MKKLSRNQLRLHRKKRIRAKVKGTMEIPRACVFRSLKRLEVQIINDEKDQTIFSLENKKVKVKSDMAGALELGKAVAKECLERKIKKAVFDRGGYRYHGMVKAIADGMREGGLEI